MKKFLILAALILFTANAEAANRYARGVGGNWTDDATWSTTSGGAADTVAPTASDDVFLDANSGQVTISATSVGKSLNCTGYTGTLTHNAFDLTISGSVTLVSGMTYTPSSVSSRLVMASTGTLTTGGKLLWSLRATGTLTIGDNVSFVAQKTALFTQASSTAIDINGKTISGNSEKNRLLVQSSTLGTSLNINVNGGTFANADFKDINSSGGAVDFSAITGLSGDCGGNTNITFTTAATQTYTGGTDNWSTAARWTSRVPLPQDNVVITGQSGSYTITADMPRLGKSIDFSGALGTPTWTNSVAKTNYGSLTYKSGMTLSGTNSHTFEGRGSFTLTSAGVSTTHLTIIQMVGGTLTLQDAFTTGANTVNIQLENGTLVDNGFSVTCRAFVPSSGTASHALTKTGNWTLFFTSGTVWDMGSAGTISDTAGTIFITDTGASSKTFAGRGLTYNNLSISGGGAGAVIITGANTFNRIYTNGGGTKSITLPGSTTTTIISNQGLNNGTNLITFTASAGSATIANAQGNLSWDYVSLTNIIGSTSGNGKFYAGPTTHSTDGGGNTNWVFDQAPGDRGFSRNKYIGEPGVYRR